MSRIHEALKKAAQERPSQMAASDTSVVADVATAVASPPSLGIQVGDLAARVGYTSESSSNLRFDELVKRCNHPTWQFDPRTALFPETDGGPTVAERFRTLRSRLYQIAAARSLKKVLVTSSVSGEGKTFVAANLAHSITLQEDRKVLLIDADLRASRMHLLLGAPSSPGLSDYLRGEADEYAVIQNANQSNLFFVPGGREVSNPSELLLGERMKNLLDLVTPIFDWVILDSPPALPVHDASVLADLCHGVLLVVKAGKTDYELAEKARSEFLNKNLLGVVLNGVEKKDDSYGGDYLPPVVLRG